MLHTLILTLLSTYLKDLKCIYFFLLVDVPLTVNHHISWKTDFVS